MNKPIFFMMIGLPASGKSYYAKQLAKEYHANIYSSDEIRLEILGDVNCQNKNTEVFELLHKRIKESLVSGINTIYDETNIDYKKRMAFVNEIRSINCHRVCYFMATPYSDCIRQNADRERSVPVEVIDRMYKNIYIPQVYEGWEDINIIWNYEAKNYNIGELFSRLNNINQDNPHHTFTVGKHCNACMRMLEQMIKTQEYELWIAALLHDIGKPFTKSFTNSKGEITPDAHYYQHHLVSAYDSLFFSKDFSADSLLVANYIQWHMQPFFMESEKQKDKYRNLWGEDFYNNIMLLHIADVKAK